MLLILLCLMASWTCDVVSCVLCSWLHCLFRCTLQMFVWCWCTREVIWEFTSEVLGSCSISFYLMCSGNKLPFGMWCLSARRMLLMSVVFAVYGWVCNISQWNFSFFREFYPVCFPEVSVWMFLLVKFESIEDVISGDDFCLCMCRVRH